MRLKKYIRNLLIIMMILAMMGCGNSGISESDTDEVKLSCDAESFKNRDYTEVIDELRKMGFENINTQELKLDFYISDGTTISVTIDGKESCYEGEMYRKDADVLVIYNKQGIVQKER